MAFKALAILPLLIAGITASPTPDLRSNIAVLGENAAEIREMMEVAARVAADERQDERHDMDVPVMIAREGYPVQTHTVITEDCYILQMHRIPYGKQSPPQDGVKRPAVYLQHGLLSSSADWVMGIPKKSLGYILADNGYDVWLGNYRGNYYSRNHCDLNPNKNPFWDFSWDQMGDKDIPAMVDYILTTTGHKSIHYVGHSMGTTGLMVAINNHPELKEKIIMANFLAPVAYVEHMKSPIRLIAGFADEVEWIADFLGVGEFLPSNGFMNWISGLFCDASWIQGVCESVIFLLTGFDQAQMNETLLPTIVSHTPAGASTHTILHYGQEVTSGEFCAYDHGKDNLDIYGTIDPPLYLPQKVTIPISLYWSLNDWMASPTDVLRLSSALPNLFDNYQVPFETWNHQDFVWGIDADTLVYPQVMANMAKAEKSLGA